MPEPVTLKYRFQRGSGSGQDAARPPAPRVHPDVIRRAANWRETPANPFVLPRFPPQVEQAVRNAGVATIAQDAGVMGNFGWAGQDPIYTAYAEGTVFLGYSFLASLAQRAEYRVVTETIASEMTREWIEVKVASGDEAKEDKKKIIEDRLDNLDVQHAFRKVAEYDGFFGRGHLYLDTGMTDDPDELLTDLGDGRNMLSKLKIGPTKNQKLIRVQPVEATWAYPTFYESVDPLKRDWYAPVTWYVMSREIHRSRFMTFVGRQVPDILKPAYAFGGLAMSQMLKPYVDNWIRTRQSVSDLIQNFSHNVLKTNMDASTGVGGDQVLGRVQLFNQIKNNMGTMVLDKDTEDFTNVAAPVGTLDHLQAQSQEHMAAISRIPLVKLLGIQPAGLNASSEGELIAFEDWIASFQEVLFRDPLTTIIDMIQLTEFGEVDDDITFDFKPLRQLKPIELAQLETTKAQAREIYVQIGSVGADEVREVLAQDPDSPFDGLDLTKPLEQPGMPGMPGIPGAEGSPLGGGGAGGLPPPPKPPSAPKPPAPPKPPMPRASANENDSANFMREFDRRYPFGGDLAIDATPLCIALDDWQETDHPRDESGQFTSGHSSNPHLTPILKKYGFEGKTGATLFKHPEGTIKIHPPEKEGQKTSAVWSFKETDGPVTHSGNAAKSLSQFLETKFGKKPPTMPSSGISGPPQAEVETALKNLLGPQMSEAEKAEIEAALKKPDLFGPEPTKPAEPVPETAIAPKEFHEPLTQAGFVNETPLKWQAPDGKVIKVYSSGEWKQYPHYDASFTDDYQASGEGLASLKDHLAGKQAESTASLESEKPKAYPSEPKVGDITPPNGIQEVMPNKQSFTSMGGNKVTTYSNASDDNAQTQQVSINEDGHWSIWTEDDGIVATGSGQQELNEAFEKLHPRDEHGHFIGKAGEAEAAVPAGLAAVQAANKAALATLEAQAVAAAQAAEPEPAKSHADKLIEGGKTPSDQETFSKKYSLPKNMQSYLLDAYLKTKGLDKYGNLIVEHPTTGTTVKISHYEGSLPSWVVYDKDGKWLNSGKGTAKLGEAVKTAKSDANAKAKAAEAPPAPPPEPAKPKITPMPSDGDKAAAETKLAEFPGQLKDTIKSMSGFETKGLSPAGAVVMQHPDSGIGAKLEPSHSGAGTYWQLYDPEGTMVQTGTGGAAFGGALAMLQNQLNPAAPPTSSVTAHATASAAAQTPSSSGKSHDTLGWQDGIKHKDYPGWNQAYHDLLKAAPNPTSSEVSAITKYSGQSYRRWNDSKRDDHGVSSSEFEKADERLTAWLKKASFPEQRTIKRMVSGAFAKHLIAEATEGAAEIIDHGYSSGDKWSGELSLMITIPKGAQAAAIGHWSSHPTENEILIQAGSKYRLDSYDPKTKTLSVSLVRSGKAGEGILHDVSTVKNHVIESTGETGGTSPAKLKEIANDPAALNALGDSAHELGQATTGDLKHINSELKKAVQHWVQPDGYKLVQDHLRKQKTSPAAQQEADALQAAILGNPLEQGVHAWRGVHGPLAKQLNAQVPKAIFGSQGFFATTLDPKRATHYAAMKNSQDLMHVEVPEGYQGLYVSHPELNPGHQGERELLLPHSSQFRYLGRETVEMPVYDYSGNKKGETQKFTLHRVRLMPRLYDNLDEDLDQDFGAD